MTLPTPTHQFFTTENVLYDTISGTNLLSQNNPATPVINSTLIFAGKEINCFHIRGEGSHVLNSALPPYGNDSFLYSNINIHNGTVNTISYIVFIPDKQRLSRATFAFINKRAADTVLAVDGLNHSFPSASTVGTGITYSFQPSAYSGAVTEAPSFVILGSYNIKATAERIDATVGEPLPYDWSPVLITSTKNGAARKLYFNGILVASGSPTTYTDVDVISSIGAFRNSNFGKNYKAADLRIWNNVVLTDEQILELYNSYLGTPTPTTPVSLVVTPNYLYPTSTISATGSGSDGEEYHYEFYNVTDSVLLQDYSVTNTYSLNTALRNKQIRISVKGYTSDAEPPYSEALSTTKLVYTPKQKLTFGTGSVDIIWGP